MKPKSKLILPALPRAARKSIPGITPAILFWILNWIFNLHRI